MKKILLPKELILIIVPLLISAFVNSISNYYEFNVKTKELYFSSFNKLSEGNFELKIQKEIIDYQVKISKEVENRYNAINDLKINQANKDSINKHLEDIAEQIGIVESMSDNLVNQWQYSKSLIELLESERKLFISIKNNSMQNENDYYTYKKNHSKFQHSNIIWENKYKYFEEQSIKNFHFKNDKAITYKWLSITNLILSIIFFISLICIGFYCYTNKIFK